MLKKFTNNEIYTIASSRDFENFNSYIPAKANFAIQKNFKTLSDAAQEIEQARLNVIKHYGELDENGSMYNISNENTPIVNKELNELFNVEQELDIRTFNIEDLGKAEFTPSQMQIIMFMIED